MFSPCVVGCEAVKIDEKAQTITVAGQTVKAGDFLTINGTTGDVMIGKVPTAPATYLYSRGATPAGTLDGFIDRTVVQQAVANAQAKLDANAPAPAATAPPTAPPDIMSSTKLPDAVSPTASAPAMINHTNHGATSTWWHRSP